MRFELDFKWIELDVRNGDANFETIYRYMSVAITYATRCRVRPDCTTRGITHSRHLHMHKKHIKRHNEKLIFLGAEVL